MYVNCETMQANMAITWRISEREFTNYTLQAWQANESWVSLAGAEELAESQAREYFWQKVESQVYTELCKLEMDGWELAEEPGPQAIKLRKSQKFEFGVMPSDILLWFMTLGVALVIQLYLNTPRRYVIYEPVQVRLRMFRPKRLEIGRAA